MPLTPREAFKVAFLARCIEDGLTPDEMLSQVKQAQEKFAALGNFAGKVLNVGKGVLKAGIGWGVPIVLAAPPIIGGIGGAALAKATDIDDRDVADIKDQEVIDEYRRQTERLRRQRAVRDYQQLKQKTGRIFL